MGQPTTLEQLRGSLRQRVLELADAHNADAIAVFGSTARGESTRGSDIDFLVRFTSDSTLFDVLRLSDALSELLGQPVDVVSEGGLKDRDAHILAEAVPLA